MKEIGENLQEARINHGVSIEEAAEDLNMSTSQLENLEEGNTRAFKDIYQLKELVREYAKYLGLDANKILDEFNDFLFEKTSKISLADILEAKNIKKEEDISKKVISPYTIIPVKKINYGPFVLGFLVLTLAILLIYLVIQGITGEQERTEELKGIRVISEERCYEFAKQNNCF
ncbi:MAG: helix-turn-helix domain-containing protein [Bacilli bacterium]